ncbi:MAG: type I methionyl aminopeptidase [Adlercreutzia equolifaciens]
MGEAVGPGITHRRAGRHRREGHPRRGRHSRLQGLHGGFPGSICASVNDAVVHGIPSRKLVLREGDIISIDTGAIVDGWVGDNAWTYPVGKVAPEMQRLLEVGERCMWEGLDNARPTKRLGDIGHAVQSLAEAAGYSVVRDYGGHGIGREVHEDPNVPNFGRRRHGVEASAGHGARHRAHGECRALARVKQCSDGLACAHSRREATRCTSRKPSPSPRTARSSSPPRGASAARAAQTRLGLLALSPCYSILSFRP